MSIQIKEVPYISCLEWGGGILNKLAGLSNQNGLGSMVFQSSILLNLALPIKELNHIKVHYISYVGIGLYKFRENSFSSFLK